MRFQISEFGFQIGFQIHEGWRLGRDSSLNLRLQSEFNLKSEFCHLKSLKSLGHPCLV
jgi:hypothetical protein